MYTYHKMPALHVGDSRHVGNHVIFLVPTERVFQILKFLPFAASILLWVLAENVKLLLYLLLSMPLYFYFAYKVTTFISICSLIVQKYAR